MTDPPHEKTREKEAQKEQGPTHLDGAEEEVRLCRITIDENKNREDEKEQGAHACLNLVANRHLDRVAPLSRVSPDFSASRQSVIGMTIDANFFHSSSILTHHNLPS